MSAEMIRRAGAKRLKGGRLSAAFSRRAVPRAVRSPRRGLTLLELLILVVVLVVGIWLVTSWILQRRELARRVECLDRLQELGRAVAMFADQNGDALPYLADDVQGWPTSLLLYLGPAGLDEQVAGGRWQGQVVPPKKVRIEVFVCPADAQKRADLQGLSYVANAGYGLFPVVDGRVQQVGVHSAEIDLDGDGTVTERERQVNRATGVWWRPADDDFRMTREWIQREDGLSMTLLLTENVHAGTWSSTDVMDIGFVIGRETLQFRDPDRTGPQALALDQPVQLGPFAPNAALRTGRVGEAPAPSSWHGGVVNVVFCDGRGQVLNTKIDPWIYALLLTSAGTRYGQAPLAQGDF